MVRNARVNHIRALSRRMVRSGRFCSWRLIEIELRFVEGVREAAGCFSDPALRAELDTLCRAALCRTRPAFMARLSALFPPIPADAFVPPPAAGGGPVPDGASG